MHMLHYQPQESYALFKCDELIHLPLRKCSIRMVSCPYYSYYSYILPYILLHLSHFPIKPFKWHCGIACHELTYANCYLTTAILPIYLCNKLKLTFKISKVL